MKDENTPYFEISSTGNSIRIEILELSYPNAELNWDMNWVNSVVSIKAGAFSGQFNAAFITSDFENFKLELIDLYNNLNGIATFTTLEDQVNIKVTGDGIGHLNARCEVMDDAGIGGNILKFEIDFDQTHIPGILSQLDKITTKFTINRG